MGRVGCPLFSSSIYPLRSFAVFAISLLIISSIGFASAASSNLTYDANGNLVQGLGRFVEYDSFNRISLVRENNANGRVIEQYSYDAEGNRIKKVEVGTNGNSTIYYLGNDFVQIVNSSGTFNETYYYDESDLVAKKTSTGDLQFYHPDQLGSTSLVTNSSGGLIEETAYLPYGETIEGGNNRFTFTGKESDSGTDLYYFGARYYDPSFSHFIQPDDVLSHVYDPQQLNRYSYAVNNPYGYTDPSGNNPLLIGVAAGFGVGFVGSVLYQAYQSGWSYSNINYWDATRAGIVTGVGVATFGLVDAPIVAGLAARGVSPLLAGGGAGTVAGSLAGETGLVASSILDNNLGRLADPMAHAQAISYGGLSGGLFGGLAEGFGQGLNGARGVANDIPKVSNAKLQNYVNDFYKGTKNPNRVGSGTTADAIRYELRTGESVGGRTHIQKGQDLLRGLDKWTTANPNSQDIDLAKAITRDLRNALGGY